MWLTATTKVAVICLIMAMSMVLTACTSTVHVVAPQKPIVINLNIKVKQEIRLKVEKDVDKLFKRQQGLF